MYDKAIIAVIDTCCSRLLCEVDRDPFSHTYGCFDRRYWSWKIVDYPEATYQRNALIFAKIALLSSSLKKQVLIESAKAALLYSVKIQHADGSFDQAFPNEHGFGATAFLLDSLIDAYQCVKDSFNRDGATLIEQSLLKAADFMIHHDETHGMISNHIAGAALALLKYGRFSRNKECLAKADEFLSRVIDSQYDEGWFMEYDGADPGYQTLCMHYLSQYYLIEPDDRLRKSLEKSFEFLKWFVHPDGTFGGEYGSRRTSVFYPSGFVLLAGEFPVAAAIWNKMRDSLCEGLTVTPDRIDIGNMAPALSSWLLSLEKWSDGLIGIPELPCQSDSNVSADFTQSGILIRGFKNRYIIFGASNGGVIKVFERDSGKILLNDCGYISALRNGSQITTQITELNNQVRIFEGSIELEAPFFVMPSALPTPFKFIILRILNLTLMNSIRAGNLMKSLLVKMLISQKKTVPLALSRKLSWNTDGRIIIDDRIFMKRKIPLKWLKHGIPFCGIHMASAKYFEQFNNNNEAFEVDVSRLYIEGQTHSKKEL